MKKTQRPSGWDWDEVAAGPSITVGLSGADRLYDAFGSEATTAFVRDVQHELAPGSIVEVGCGKGQWLRLLVDHGFDIVGGDVSLGMLRRAHLIAPVAQLDAAHLPFADGSFDNAITVTVLQHLRDPEPAMAELARVARHRIVMHEMTGSLVPHAITPGTTARRRQWYEATFAELGWALRGWSRTPRPGVAPLLRCVRASPQMLPRGAGLYAATHEWLVFDRLHDGAGVDGQRAE